MKSLSLITALFHAAVTFLFGVFFWRSENRNKKRREKKKASHVNKKTDERLSRCDRWGRGGRRCRSHRTLAENSYSDDDNNNNDTIKWMETSILIYLHDIYASLRCFMAEFQLPSIVSPVRPRTNHYFFPPQHLRNILLPGVFPLVSAQLWSVAGGWRLPRRVWNNSGPLIPLRPAGKAPLHFGQLMPVSH